MALFDLKINGTSRSVDVSDDTPLLWVLRDELNMCGTKYGCGIAQCGACTVHLNGIPTRSCVLPVSALGNSEITTIEGLSADGSHPVQKAWDQLDVPQCGYCQAGQMMTAAAFVSENKNPSDEEISTAMSGNICRCGTYHRIKEAVKLAANLSK
ncbi:(2Fe-2S)-binding protein [Lacihabitans lacunae]|uniref:(2Fe-2S)-binding protein n=1 Tax=Lacihabitans lacunae TaxID=1028214 RepID=A0ABV7YSY1_9BACT